MTRMPSLNPDRITRIVRITAPPREQLPIARLGYCPDCSREMRRVLEGAREVWVDPRPVPGGPLVINGDQVLMDRYDGGIGFWPHTCAGSRR